MFIVCVCVCTWWRVVYGCYCNVGTRGLRFYAPFLCSSLVSAGLVVEGVLVVVCWPSTSVNCDPGLARSRIFIVASGLWLCRWQPRCLECGEMGHMQKLCPKVTCRRCGLVGHMTAACSAREASRAAAAMSRAAGGGGGGGSSSSASASGEGKVDRKWAGGHQPRCLECGEVGHMLKNCPKVMCRRCGKVGHMSAACPLG